MYKIKLRTKTTLDLRSKTKREKTKRRGCCPTKGILTVHFIHEVLRTKAWDKEHTDKRHTLNTWQMISIYTLVPQMIENRWTGQHGYYFYLFLIDQNPSFFFMFICKKIKCTAIRLLSIPHTSIGRSSLAATVSLGQWSSQKHSRRIFRSWPHPVKDNSAYSAARYNLH